MDKKWILTDASTGQYGRQISDTLFQFKEIGIEKTTISLMKYVVSQQEYFINPFGYTIGKTTDKYQNITEAVGADKVNWIIAECIFEVIS